MNSDLMKRDQTEEPSTIAALPEGIAAAMLLERTALVALKDPSLTIQEREILEKAVRVTRSIQKRLPRDQREPSVANQFDGR